MILDSINEVHPYYLLKCREMLGGLKDAIVLKTDAWNEIRLDVPGTGDIVGAFENVKEYVCVEIMPGRAAKAQEKFAGRRDVEVICGDLRDVDFTSGRFDAIICLCTVNFMPMLQAQKVVKNFHRWLRDGGRMYLTVWLTWEEDKEQRKWKPNEQFNHNLYTFAHLLWDTGFDVTEREEIYGSAATPMMVGYKCRKVPITNTEEFAR